MSITKFKSIIKGKIQLKVMSHLIALQNKHTKSEQLHFDGKMQEYLTASNLTLSDKKFVFTLRSKMLRIKAVEVKLRFSEIIFRFTSKQKKYFFQAFLEVGQLHN